MIKYICPAGKKCGGRYKTSFGPVTCRHYKEHELISGSCDAYCRTIRRIVRCIDNKPFKIEIPERVFKI
jgi:hypothetical protein